METCRRSVVAHLWMRRGLLHALLQDDAGCVNVGKSQSLMVEGSGELAELAASTEDPPPLPTHWLTITHTENTGFHHRPCGTMKETVHGY